MQINSYIFQSPSSNQVQIGRLDPNSVSEQKPQGNDSEPMQGTESSSQNTQSIQTTKTSEAIPAVTSDNLLDIYV